MRKLLVALLVGVTVGSLVYGLAASLDVISDDLGAGTDDVAACDVDGVGVSYTVAYDAAANVYAVTEAIIDGIDGTNCAGQEISVALTDGAGAELVTAGPSTIAGDTLTVPVTGSVSAEAVEGVHVAITGDDPTP